jgi:hypothetical protein
MKLNDILREIRIRKKVECISDSEFEITVRRMTGITINKRVNVGLFGFSTSR